MELQLLGKEKEMEQVFQKQRRVSKNHLSISELLSTLITARTLCKMEIKKGDAMQNADNI